MFSQNIPKVSVQKLFALALTLKIISSGLSLWLKSPWILGLAVPITIMIGYMVIGQYAREDDVSSEKFADSCYYIGFIFTITSIIFCLFDLPNLGGGEGLRNIALRFGAAMVSTVLGMGVRVYLVSFRKDTSDAIKDVEEALLDGTRMFVTQLGLVVGELQKFEIQVIDASKITAENVNRQISDLGKNYAESLDGFYAKMSEKNEAAFKELLEEVRQATSRLANSVDAYSGGMKDNLESIALRVTEFADTVSLRLTNTTFPDDFFARELKAPLDQLKSEASNLGENVRNVSSLVQESSGTLATVLKQITTKTKKTQEAMDAVVQLSEQHNTLINNADLQLNTLVKLTERMEQIDAALKDSLQVIGSNSNASTELLTRVASLSTESATLRIEIKDTMEAITAKLDTNVTLATNVIQQLQSQAGEVRTSASEIITSLAQHSNSSEKLAQQLTVSGIVSQDVLAKLQTISNISDEMAGSVRLAAQSATSVAQQTNQAAFQINDSVNKAFSQVSDVLGKVKDLDASLLVHTGDILDATQKLHRSQDTQHTLIADAVIQAITFRPDASTDVSTDAPFHDSSSTKSNP